MKGATGHSDTGEPGTCFGSGFGSGGDTGVSFRGSCLSFAVFFPPAFFFPFVSARTGSGSVVKGRGFSPEEGLNPDGIRVSGNFFHQPGSVAAAPTITRSGST